MNAAKVAEALEHCQKSRKDCGTCPAYLLEYAKRGSCNIIYDAIGALKHLSKQIDKSNVLYKWNGCRGDYTCSRCGEEAPNNGYYPAPFCYECGAKMIKGVEE